MNKVKKKKKKCTCILRFKIALSATGTDEVSQDKKIKKKMKQPGEEDE